MSQKSFHPRSSVGATASTPWYRRRTKSFNPRARVGATIGYRAALGDDRVSIHAPAWARLTDLPGFDAMVSVSIHAPAWARRPLAEALLLLPAFQSTRPRGRDLESDPITKLLQEFQSTRPRGRDGSWRAVPFAPAAVSIHAPAWARRWLPSIRPTRDGFNPRARVGATQFWRW